MALILLDTSYKIVAARIDIEAPGDATGRLQMDTYAWKGTSKVPVPVIIEDYPLDADDTYWATDVPTIADQAYTDAGFELP